MIMQNDDSPIIRWLLGNDNPAVRYRTLTELLGKKADKSEAVAWLHAFLPAGWKERKGLWFVYYLNSFAECGLSFEDTGLDAETVIGYPFDAGCGDFMRLRACARLGLGDAPAIKAISDKLHERQLPDGGFLCLHRLDKLKYTPKSCVKDNMHALLFCAECKK